MSAFGAALDACDWMVDYWRGLFGQRPLPPELLKLTADELTVRRATQVDIETRRTRLALLRVRQGDDILFEGPAPRDGKVTIVPLAKNPVELQISLEPRNPQAGTVRFESVLEPAPNGPPVERFDVPASVTLGDDIACGWSAPRAARVRLAVIRDGEITDHIGPPIGELAVPAPKPGRVLLRLTAEASWGESILTKTVTVAVPKLKLILLRPAVQAGCPGDSVRFEWRMMAAESAWLIPPGSAAPERLRETDGGFLDIKLGSRPVEYQIVARGYGGAERSIVLRAVPQPFALLED
jgi:hypothetical protein